MELDKGVLKKCLKIAHLVFACLWGGGAISLSAVLCLFTPATVHETYVLSKILYNIDTFVVGVGALGCFATGLLYAKYTPWGFFKFRWIVAKFVINIGFILWGALWYVPRIKRSVRGVQELELEGPSPGDLLPSGATDLMIDLGVVFFFVLLVSISVLKPWGRVKRD